MWVSKLLVVVVVVVVKYASHSCSFLDDVGSAGEHAQEFLELLKALIKDSSGKWKSYLAMRGVLPQIGVLITREIEYLQHLEETTLSSDLSQGCALKMLTGECHVTIT